MLSRQRAVLEEISDLVLKNFLAGQTQMFLVRQYTPTQVELLHFDVLLHGDIFSQLAFDKDPDIEEKFPPGSIVWVYREGEGVMFREATCLDEKAEQEAALVREKASKDLEEQLVKMHNGQARATAISRYLKGSVVAEHIKKLEEQ